MSSLLPPSAALPSDLLATVRRYGAEAEENGMLHPEQLRIIYEYGLLKMFVPHLYNGLNYSLPDALKAEEALAWADGSTGWFVTLCSGANWFIGFLDENFSSSIFYDKKVCLAGSGAPSGTAEIIDGGYLINGTWKYATGILHATMVTANCIITRQNIPLVGDDGKPLVKAFTLKKEEVVVEENWKTMGLIATASHGFTIKDRHVEETNAFQIQGRFAQLSDVLYQYPFLQLAETTLAVNFSGMAYRFMELCEPLFRARPANNSEKNLLEVLQASFDKLNMAREELYRAVDVSWSFCSSRENIPHIVTQRVSTTSFQLYQCALLLVHKLYPPAGIAAATSDTEINRVWRNIYTASQHTLFSMR